MAFSSGSTPSGRRGVFGSSGGRSRAEDVAELEVETRRMEARLRALKEEREKLIHKISTPIASTWVSASGPLRSTGRTVLAGAASTAARSPQRPDVDKFPEGRASASSTITRGSRPSLSAAGAAAVAGPLPSAAVPDAAPTNASQQRPSTAGRRNLVAARARDWTCAHVCEWLQVLGLERYAPTFQEHEINGAVLLDITPSDLDYMDVRALGHRKMILKGVDGLRAAVGAHGDLPVPVSQDAPPVRHAAHEGAVASEAAPARTHTHAQMVHWSQTAPLKASAATEAAPATSASLLDGRFDEDAEHAAFTEAVMAWRRSVAPASTIAAATAGDAWTNPFDAIAGAVTAATQPDSAAGASLLDGTYDEAAERAKFQAAVQSWRDAGRTDGSSAPDKPAVAEHAVVQHADTSAPVRVACYQCYKVHAASDSFALGDDAAPPAELAVQSLQKQLVSLRSKPFCCQACYTAAVDAARAAEEAAHAQLQLEAEKTAAPAEPTIENANTEPGTAPPDSRASMDAYDQQFDNEDDAAPETVALDPEAIAAAAAAAAAALVAGAPLASEPAASRQPEEQSAVIAESPPVDEGRQEVMALDAPTTDTTAEVSAPMETPSHAVDAAAYGSEFVQQEDSAPRATDEEHALQPEPAASEAAVNDAVTDDSLEIP